MKKVWDFDYNYMQRVVDKGEKLLRKDDISKEDKIEIKYTIESFKLFINGIYDDEGIYKTKNYSFEQLKHKVLYKMNREYNMLGDDFINNVLELDNILFDFSKETYPLYKLKSMDELSKESLYLYKKYLPFYYDTAKKIINNPNGLIKSSSGIFSSYCLMSNYLDEPFLLIDPREDPYVFSHELEHAVEFKLKFNTNTLYHELGPMVVEKLYIEEMALNKEDGVTNAFISRIEDTENLLDIITFYFKAMKEFKTLNFRNITDEKFLNVMLDNYFITDNYTELQESVLDIDIMSILTYIVSYFKSIEIYNKFKEEVEVGYQSLERLLTVENINFKINDKRLEEYENHFKYVKNIEKTLKK